MKCLNLRDLLGDKYRVTIDKESAEGPRDTDRWLQQIRCRRGLIHPYSDSHLALQVDYHPIVAQRLVRIGLELIQDGDQEKTFIFTPDRFPEIAELVKPYVRRHLSDDQRQKARERLAAYRANVRASADARTAIQVPAGDSKAAG